MLELLSSIYQEHRWRLICYLVSRFRVSVETAEDIVQEYFLQLIARSVDMDLKKNIFAFLMIGCRRLMIASWRSKEAREKREREASPNSIGLIYFNETLERISKLPEKQKFCIILTAAGMEPAEIAEIMGIKPTSVSQLLWKARGALR